LSIWLHLQKIDLGVVAIVMLSGLLGQLILHSVKQHLRLVLMIYVHHLELQLYKMRAEIQDEIQDEILSA